MAMMNVDEELCKIKLKKWEHPKTLLDDITAVKVQYRCKLSAYKKAAVIVRASKFNYAAVMTVRETTVRAKEGRGATAKKLLVKIHRKYLISGSRNKEANDDDDAKETALSANSDIICYHCSEKGPKKNNCPKL